jgi:hypothetical protein
MLILYYLWTFLHEFFVILVLQSMVIHDNINQQNIIKR